MRGRLWGRGRAGDIWRGGPTVGRGSCRRREGGAHRTRDRLNKLTNLRSCRPLWKAPVCFVFLFCVLLLAENASGVEIDPDKDLPREAWRRCQSSTRLARSRLLQVTVEVLPCPALPQVEGKASAPCTQMVSTRHLFAEEDAKGQVTRVHKPC